MLDDKVLIIGVPEDEAYRLLDLLSESREALQDLETRQQELNLDDASLYEFIFSKVSNILNNIEDALEAALSDEVVDLQDILNDFNGLHKIFLKADQLLLTTKTANGVEVITQEELQKV